MPAEVQPSFGPNYTAVKRLGNGSFGTVYECRDNRTNESVAIKTMPRGPKITKYTEAEMVNHSRLAGHPHVINFKEVFVTDEHLCLVMEYAIGGTLLQFINRKGRLPEHVSRRFFQQLILALDFCHKNGIAVRDIKLENVLLQTPPVDTQGTPADDSWLLKLCDFGYSKSELKSAMKSQVGTLVYMAPEILQGRGAHYDGKAADIWSCGIMLYIMLCAKYPYNVKQDAMADHQEILKLLDLMKNRQFHIPPEVKISDTCRNFLMELLQPDAEKRLTMAAIYQHPWFRSDLPEGVEGYNSFVLANSANYRSQMQTAEQISDILQQAQRNPFQERLRGLTGGQRTQREREDALIDEMIMKSRR